MIGSQNFVTETYVVIMKFQTSLENGYLKCLQEKKTKKILTNVDVAHRTLHAKQWQRKMMGFVYKPVIIPPCSNCRIYSPVVRQYNTTMTILIKLLLIYRHINHYNARIRQVSGTNIFYCMQQLIVLLIGMAGVGVSLY